MSFAARCPCKPKEFCFLKYNRFLQSVALFCQLQLSPSLFSFYLFHEIFMHMNTWPGVCLAL